MTMQQHELEHEDDAQDIEQMEEVISVNRA